MPKHLLISGKVVLARVIRALGYKLPSTYIDDVLEFIGEGLGMLQASNTLITTSTGNINCPGELLVRNHCVCLPCGFVHVIAVEDENGRRLPEGSDVTDLKSQTNVRQSNTNQARPNVFNVDPYVHQTADGVPTDEASASLPYFGEDLTQADTTSRTNHYYKIQGNYIQTSFESGYIKLHYLTIPVDKEGYPLIPDNEAFKQALEWHIIRRLIGSGYQHPVFSWDKANEQFEIYAARALNEISYYSPEGAAKLNRSFVRLIPNYSAYSDFFINNESDEYLRK